MTDSVETTEGVDAPAMMAHDLLRRWALATPDRVLLEAGALHITYGEMDERVDRLAQWLLDNASGPGRRIGLQTSDTEALILGVLGLLRAGMVSIPLDPTAPAPWVGQALTDAGATLLLSDVAVASAEIPCAVVHPAAVGSPPPTGGVAVPLPPFGSIVYTSGSTGDPKGVIMPVPPMAVASPHLGAGRAGLEPDAVRMGFLGHGSVGFPLGVVGGILSSGATVVDYDIRSRGIHGLGPWLAENRIWATTTVPTVLRHLVATMPHSLHLPELRRILLYGEASTWEDVGALWPHLGPEARVTSYYASTESGTVSVMRIAPNTVAETGRLPAGRVSDGVKVTIEDDLHRHLPAGEIGEIVAWTKDGGQGYWNRPEETARVFGASDDDGRHFVRTGDLGRIRPDGLLEHIGRMDDMVKVSGHRVALSEIEQTLRQLDGVVDAVAVPVSDAGGNVRIITYVVPASGSAPDAKVLRDALASRLPVGAVPDRVLFVKQLPTLANGKADRNSLRTTPPCEDFAPTPVPAQVRRPNTEASDEIMRAILAMWSDILGFEAHEDDDFFDSGGDSLRAARLFAEIELKLNADLPLSLLMEASTPRLLSAAILSEAGHDNPVVPLRTKGTRPPLFIVHDVTGSVLFARIIASRLDESQPVYAIRGDAQLGVVTGAENIQELAARYVPSVLGATSGACALYGSSAGGVIAFELALQLADKGVDITFLGLGDSKGPGIDLATLRLDSQPRRQERLRVRRRLNDLRAAPWPSRPRLAANFFWHRAGAEIRHRVHRRHHEVGPPDEVSQAAALSLQNGTPLPRQLRARYGVEHYGQLSVNYRPSRRFNGSIALLRTPDEGHETRGWADYVTGTVHVFPLSNFHYQLLEEATLEHIGEVLEGALTNSEP